MRLVYLVPRPRISQATSEFLQKLPTAVVMLAVGAMTLFRLVAHIAGDVKHHECTQVLVLACP